MEENNNVPVEKGKNGIGNAGFVCGLLGFILMISPLFKIWTSAGLLGVVVIVSWILCILAFIFSLIGVIKRNVKKTLAIIGLILSLAGPIFWFIYISAQVN